MQKNLLQIFLLFLGVTYACKITPDGSQIVCKHEAVNLNQLELDRGQEDDLPVSGFGFRSGNGQSNPDSQKPKTTSPIVTNPAVLKKLTKLKSFFAEDSGLEKLPAKMFEFNQNLNHIVFSKNNIKMLPDNLLPTDSSAIIDLRFDQNNLGQIPGNYFDGLVNLETLHLEYNFLVYLPDKFLEKCGKLRELYLHDNLLVRLGNSRFFNFPASLENLYLQNNKLNSCQCLVQKLGQNDVL